MSKMREQFEEALKKNPDARFWNTTDAMFWAWQAALSQPAAVEGWHNVVDNVANNLGEFAGAMPTQDMADTLTEYANDLFGLLSAAPATPSAPVQQSVREGMEMIVAGALFDFMGWLTTRPGSATFGDKYEAGVAVELLQEWAKTRDLNLSEAAVLSWSEALSTSPLLDKNDQAEGAVTGAIADRIKAIACKDIISVDDKHRLLEISLSVRVLLQGKSQLRRDAERWRYCVSRGDFPKRPIKAATGQQSAGWLYKVSEFRVWFDSAGEAADAALAQSPSKKGGE